MVWAQIAIPNRMDTERILYTAQLIDYYSGRDEVRISFEENSFFSPFSLLLIGAKLRDVLQKNPSLRIEVRGHQAQKYAAHMGFFRMFGFDYGRDIGEAWGSENYLPITCVDRSHFYRTKVDRLAELGDLIQREAEKIAEVVTRGRRAGDPMFDALAYSVRELMRNVFEHSETSKVYYCAQFWPGSNRVEFAIADFGIGIRRGLGTNPNFRFETDKEAIEYSLLPSVSGKTHLPVSRGTWTNSGYGLYMTNRLARNAGGNFVIASGSTAIHLSRQTKRNYRTSFPGTALRFNLNLGQIDDAKAKLDQFRKEGYEIAKQIKGTGNRPPSAMSVLLRRDYSR